MANCPTDIVSLSLAKNTLRIPMAVAEDDARIELMIAETVDWVQRKLGHPLIILRERYLLEYPPDPREPVDAAWYSFRETVQYAYWQPADGTPVTVTDSDALPIYDGNGVLWPPADGWPQALEGAPLSIDIDREFDVEGNPSIRRVVLALLSDFYDGVEPELGSSFRIALEAIGRQSPRQLKPAQVLRRGNVDLPDGVLTWRGQPVTLRGAYVVLRPGGQVRTVPRG